MKFLSKLIKRDYMIVVNDSENEEGLMIPTKETNMFEAIRKSDLILYKLNRGEANKYRFSLSKIAEYSLVPLSHNEENTSHSPQSIKPDESLEDKQLTRATDVDVQENTADLSAGDTQLSPNQENTTGEGNE